MATNTKGIYYRTNADAAATSEAQALSMADSIPVGRNFLINSAFDIWQRGTSSTAAGYQTADRWYGNASNTTTFAQDGSVAPTGFRYSYRMTAGATGAPYVEQAIETLDAVLLAGQTVTLSSYLLSSTALSVNLQLYYSTSENVGPAGAWTQIGSVAAATTTSWGRYSATFAVPANARSLKASLVGPTITSGTYICVAGVQLEAGSAATPFRRAGVNIRDEFANCQRYYQTAWMVSRAYGAVATLDSGPSSHYSYPVTMRVNPSLTITGISLSGSPGGYDYFFEGSSERGTAFTYRHGNGTGSGNLYFSVTWKASAEL